MKTKFVLLPILLVFASLSFSQSEFNTSKEDESNEISLEERKALLLEEIRKRRALRTSNEGSRERPQHDPANSGAVYQPKEKNEKDLDGMTVSNMAVGIIAEFYAELIGKEVMVSSKVSDLKFNIKLGKTKRSDAIDAFEQKLTELGISIVELTNEIVVLVDKEEWVNKSVDTTAVSAPR